MKKASQELSSNNDDALRQRVKMIFWNLSGLFSYEDSEILKALQQYQKLKN